MNVGLLAADVIVGLIIVTAIWCWQKAKTRVLLSAWRQPAATALVIRRRSERLPGMWLPRLVDPSGTCPHMRQRGIYGDAILNYGGKRARCHDCGRCLPNLPTPEQTVWAENPEHEW